MDFDITPDDIAAYNDYMACGGQHAYQPYDNGGVLTPITSWVSSPEEAFVLTDEQLTGIYEAAKELGLIISTRAGDS
ncbi:hypothetical protein [Streptomyces lydicus]|uniref:hypothetical protein n=1 Tax=Streptomyces lydicus TaxID=47763 RepID=UPI003796ED3C